MNPIGAILESLEVRLLLDASVPRDVFAQLDAPVTGGAPVPINVTIAPSAFTAAGGKVLVGFVHSAATGCALNPGAVTIRNAGTGAVVAPLVSSLSISGSNGSLALVDLPAGSYQITVTGEAGTTGAGQLSAFLVGDANGDGASNDVDGLLIRDLTGAVVGDGRYTIESDVNRDGRITTADYTIWRSARGDATTIRPLSGEATLSPAPFLLANGTRATRFANSTLVGTAAAGVTFAVALDQDGAFDDGTATVGGAGTFEIPVTLVSGPNLVNFEAKDSFGQRKVGSIAVTLDTVAPTVVFDSPAPGTLTNRNVVIQGHITDPSGITLVEYREDGETWTIIPVNPSGEFSVLTSLTLAGTVDGLRSVHVRAVDGIGNTSAPVSLTFTLDTLAPLQPVFDLDPAFDSAPVGDSQTTFSEVTLVGQTEPGAQVTLVTLGTSTVAGGTGRFEFTGVALANGSNAFTVRATDAAGNQSTYSRSITRSGETETNAPVITVGLVNDTARGGLTNTDHVTADPAIAGTVSDGGGVASFRIALIGAQPANFVEAVGSLSPDGHFAFTRSQLETLLGVVLAEGPNTLQFEATDSAGNTSEVLSLSFVLDTVVAVPTLELSVGSRSSSSAIIANSARVTLVGHAEPNAIVTLVETGATALASATGLFQFPDVDLAVGENSFNVGVADVAGNTTSTLVTFERQDAGVQVDPVARWNTAALEAVRMDASAPPVATRFMAMVSLAMYDVISAVEGTPRFYVTLTAPAGLSLTAAISAAAHRVLEYAYPAQRAAFNAILADVLSAVPDGAAEAAGIAFGRQVADAIIAIRSGDGWDRFVDYVPGSAPGDWQPTVPIYDVALLPQWGQLTPFALAAPDQFRPDGPPALDSAEYAADVNEIKGLGRATGSTRTAEQTQIARFWADGSGTYTPAGHWNQIALQFAQARGYSPTATARLMAQLNVALADAAIVAWDAKFTYDTWRPVTAIQQAALDGNDATTPDPDWQSFLITPPFGDYVSGHSTFSGAAAEILTALIGDGIAFGTTSYGLPGVTRSFTSFQQAAEEAGRSRIYGGIHFQYANVDGLAAGRQLAQYVLGRFSASVDDRAPTVVLEVSPAPVVRENVTISGQVLDNLSGVASLKASIDEGTLFPVSFDGEGRFSLATAFLLDGSVDGTHTLQLIATDVQGNTAAPVELTFTLDTRAPVFTLDSPTAGQALNTTSRLTGLADPTGSAITSLRYSFNGGTSLPVAVDPITGSFDQALDISQLSVGTHSLGLIAVDAAGNTATHTVSVSIAAVAPLTITSVTPTPGSGDVGSTYRPQVFFSKPVNAASLNANNFYATDTTGAKIPATIVPANDGSFAWLFFTNPLPGASTVTVHVVGDTILAANDGQPLDADGNGTAGGSFTYQFTTVSLVPLAGTSLSGKVVDPGADLKPMTFDDMRAGPDGILHSADDVFLNPITGVKVFILGLESQYVLTDAQGNFHFNAVPSGTIKLAIDGHTATNAPAGFFFPEMVMDLEIEVGQANTVMGTMGTREEREANRDRVEAYLPRLRTDMLQTVSTTDVTVVSVNPTAAPNLTDQQRQALRLEVQPGSLVDHDGQPLANGQVGISTVPPELVRDMLPPGLLQHTFDITIQAPGAASFAVPLEMTFPNVFNAAPGTKLNFLSFDHTTGRLVIEGTATVSADGLTVTTDPGTGVTKPGWHGVTPPGVQTSSPRPKSTPDPKSCEEIMEILNRDYESKRLTPDAALAHQIACIAEHSCEAEGTWGGGFVHDVMSDIANQTASGSFSSPIPSWVPFANEIAAVLGGFGYHFPEQLLPAFINHCDELNDEQHDSFFNNAVLPCFDEVVAAGELAPWAGELAKKTVPAAATILRELVQAFCPLLHSTPSFEGGGGQFSGGGASGTFNLMEAPIVLPSRASRDDLYDPAIDTLGTLSVTAADGSFFLPVGGKIQLQVTRHNPDGSLTPLTSGASGTQYYLAINDQLILIDSDGLITVKGTTSPFAALTPVMYVIVRNGSDVGIGQFAITDVDTSGTGIVDSWKDKLSIPRTSTNAAADLNQLTQYMLSQLKGPSAESSRPSFYAIESLDTGFTVRGLTSTSGAIDGVFLGADQAYRVWQYEPVGRSIGSSVFRTGSSGSNVTLPSIIIQRDHGLDPDGDGLSDQAEFIIGTDSSKWSTTGDGVGDGAKVEQGLDPLDNRGFPTGIIATQALIGEAKEVVVSGTTNAQMQTSYVATGSYGLAIVDTSQFNQPVVLSQLDLAGDSTDLAVDSVLKIAAVAANVGGLHLIDIADSTNPSLIRTINVQVSQVEIVDGIAYAAVGSELRAYDLLTGEKLQSVDLGGTTITGLCREGEFLYAMDSSRTLRAIGVSGGVMVVRGSLIMPGGGGKLFVGGGIAYVSGTNGFATANVSNPNSIVLISGADATNLQAGAVVANGSGLAIGVGSVLGSGLDVFDVSNPANTAAFLTRINLPGTPSSVAIASGLAFVAGGSSGLQVVNYLPFDNRGIAPIVTSTVAVADIDAVTPGIQAQEATSVTVAATVSDDVQVRNVELLMNGQVVRNDVSFPYDLSVALPTIAANGSATVTVQVRATDTGGNVGLSQLVTVQLVPDTFAPTISKINPPNASKRGQAFRTVIVDFTEPMDLSTLTSSSIQLIGPSGVVAPTNIQFRNSDKSVQLTYPVLEGGTNQIVIDAAAITDRAGNALGSTPITSSFSTVQATAVWINPLGGFWDVASNWDTGVVPGPTDDVLIDIPGGATITYRSGNTEIRTLSSNNPVTISGGTLTVSQTVQVNNVFTLSGGTLKDATVLTGSGGQSIAGSSGGGRLLNVTVNGDLTLSASGARLFIEGTTTFANAHLGGNSSGLGFGPGTVLTGNILFEGPNTGSRAVSMNGSSGTLTIAPTGSIRTVAGFAGSVSVGSGVYFGGSMTLVNHGTTESSVSGRTITLTPTSLTNSGTLAAMNGGLLSANGLTGNLGTATLSGSGSQLLLDGTNYVVNAGLTAPAGTTLELEGSWTNAVGSTISATGATLNLGDQFASSTDVWSNSGTISAVNSTVNLGGLFTMTGLGTLNRTGGTVNLVGTLNNTGATLTLNSTTGAWNLKGGKIQKGTYSSTGGAQLIFTNSGGILDGVTVQGDLDLATNSGALTYVENGLTLDNATVRLGNAAGSTYGYLYFRNGSQTLGGTGTVLLGKSSSNTLYNQTSNTTLTVGAGVTIRGSRGYIYGTSNTTLVNQGTIAADDSGGIIPGYSYDTGYSSSWAYTVPDRIDTSTAANAAPEAVYQTFREYYSFNYTLDGLTPGASYTLRLHFMESTYNAVGQRRFHVDVNSVRKLTDYDIFATAGGRYRAVTEDVTVTADANGKLVVQFTSPNSVARVNGLELLSGATVVTGLDAGQEAGSRLYVQPAVVQNQGTFKAENGSILDVSGLTGNLGTATLSGSGSQLLLDGTNYVVNAGLTAPAGTTLELEGSWTNAVGSTISATGATLNLGDQFASSTDVWSNSGTISAVNSTVNLGGLFTMTGLGTLNRTGGTVNLVGTLNNTGATLTLNSTTGAWNLKGGKIQKGTYSSTGGAQLIFTNSGGILDGVTVQGDLDLATNSGALTYVENGLTLDNATVRLGNAAGSTYGYLYFRNGSQTLGGTGTVLLGKSSSNTLYNQTSNTTLTVGAGVTIRGSRGYIYGTSNTTLVNQGTIAADDSGGIIPGYSYDTGYSSSWAYTVPDRIDTSTAANAAPEAVYQTFREYYSFNYTLDGLTPGASYTLRLHFMESTYNAVGQRRFHVDVNSVRKLTDYDIFATAGGRYRAVTEDVTVTADANGKLVVQFTSPNSVARVNGLELLSGATVVTGLDAGQEAGSRLYVQPAVVQNQGTFKAENGSILDVSGLTGNLGTATLSGSGSQLLLDGTNYVVNAGLTAPAGTTLELEGSWTNAVGSTISATGATLNLGDQFASSTDVWSNSGTISAVNSTVNLGGLFTMTGLGTLNRTGGTVNLVGTLNNTGATLTLNSTTGAWNLKGGKIQKGTYSSTGGAQLIFTNSGGILDGVTVQGDLDLATNSGALTYVENGLTLDNATVRLGNAAGSTYGYLYFRNGSQTLGGTGTVLLGKSSSNTLYNQTSNTTLTVGAGVTIRGSRGYIYGTSNTTLVNQGTIAADDSGGIIPGYSYDTGYSSSWAYTVPDRIDTSTAANAAPEAVYQTFREYYSFNYTLDGLTPGASYTLRLHFMESTYNAVGQRRFHVDVNSVRKLTDYDIFATAGGRYRAVTEDVTVTADANGKLVVQFTSPNSVARVNGLELLSGATVVTGLDAGQEAGSRLYVQPAVVQNQGTFKAENGSILDVSGLTGNLGTATLSGSGSQLLLDGTNYVVNAGLTAPAGTTLELEGSWTNAVGSTISATGATLNLGDQFASSTDVWSNSGTISAVNSTVNLGGLFTMTGLGTLNRTGGTVNLVGTLNNTGATLTLNSTTGAWNLKGGKIQKGTYSSTGGAQLIFTNSGGILDGVTVQGDLDLATNSGALTYVENGLTLDNATVRLGNAAGSTYGYLYFRNGSQTLGGTGTVLLGKSSSNTLYNQTSNTTLTVGAGVTIRGSRGYIYGTSNTTLVNQGTIAADDSGGIIPGYSYDTGYSSSWAYTVPDRIDTSTAANAAPEAVYQTFREYYSFNYTLDGLTPGASYTLRLHFMESTYNAVGQRRFHVDVNSVRKLTDYDIFATAGGRYRAVTEDVTVTADANGKLVVQFTSPNSVARVNGLELLSGATVVTGLDAGQEAGSRLYVQPAVVQNQGTFKAENGSILDVSGLTGNLGTATLSGSGSQLLLDGTNYVVNAGLTAPAGTTLELEGSWTNAVGSTISATGATLNLGDQFASSTDVWSNSGTISAVNSTVNLGGLFTMTGLGTLNRTGGTVNLVGTLNNTGATLTLNSTTGAWNLNGGTISGGTLDQPDGVQLEITSNSSNRLLNVTVAGALALSASNALVRIEGTTTFANAHMLGNTSVLAFGPGTVLTGNILFEGPNTGSRLVSMNGSSGTLTIAPTGSIRTVAGFAGSASVGSGVWYGGNMTLVNQGTIESAVAGRTISLSPTSLTNSGTLAATGGGSLSVSSLTMSAGTISSGAGSLISVSGNLILGSADTIRTELGGTLPSQFGRISVSGTATLNGTLRIDLVNGFVPATGNSFQILTYSSRTGTFATLIGASLSNGNTLSPDYQPLFMRLLTS